VSEIKPNAPPLKNEKKIRPPDELKGIFRLLVILVVALMLFGSTGFLVHLRQSTIENAEENTIGVARLLDETLTRTLGTTDMLLRRMAEIARAQHHGRITAAQERNELADLQASLPERGSIVVIDANGDTIASLIPSPVGTTVNLSDRPWFKAHAEGTEMVVAPMVFARYSNNLIFTVSRRVSDDQGNFIGVVACGIHATYFTNFYNSLVLGQEGVIAAASPDGLILRQPNPELYVGRSVQNAQFLSALKENPTGTVQGASPFDGIERINAYRKLKDFNIVVVAGMALDEVLAPWWSTVGALCVALLLAGTAVAGLAVMAFRGIGREQEILAGLEQRVRERTEEAERRAEEARLANESKTRFLAAASHDLRQPLQAAGMFAEVLSARVTDPNTVAVVAQIGETLTGMTGMLNALLDINQIEAGAVRADMAAIAVQGVLTKLRDEFVYTAQEKHLDLRVVGCSLTIWSDPRLLEQMLRNLLANALKYTRGGKVLLGCRRRGQSLSLEVWDTGVGIPESEIGAIFEEFHQIGNEARERSRGLGLGLSIVRRLGNLLGHRVRARSHHGNGSVFSIEAPLAPNAPRARDKMAERGAEADDKAARKGAVLIVDDDRRKCAS